MDEEPSLRRRLAAILAADIAGYSRLMHADDAATVRDLKAHQSAILPLIGRHGGRIIDTAGDGIMAEFRASSATECAVEIQTVMAQRNAGTRSTSPTSISPRRTRGAGRRPRRRPRWRSS